MLHPRSNTTGSAVVGLMETRRGRQEARLQMEQQDEDREAEARPEGRRCRVQMMKAAAEADAAQEEDRRGTREEDHPGDLEAADVRR